MSELPDPLDAAIARHYAREQEGLPPPVPSTMHLWIPHRRWLREYFPLPRPVGGWPEPIPSFEWWLEHRWPQLQREGITPPASAPAPVSSRRPAASSATGIPYCFARRSNPANPSPAITARTSR